MQLSAHQGKRPVQAPHCQHLDPGLLASRTGRKTFFLLFKSVLCVVATLVL